MSGVYPRFFFSPQTRIHARNIGLHSPPTITAAVTTDHRELLAYAHKLRVLDPRDSDSRVRFQNQFSWLLTKHLLAEELCLYPLFSSKHKESNKKDHEDVSKTYLLRLFLSSSCFFYSRVLGLKYSQIKIALEYYQRIYPHSYEFIPKLNELMSLLEPHFREEEKYQLPELEDMKAVEGGTKEIAHNFRRCQMWLPSRCHPWLDTEAAGKWTIERMLTLPIDVLGDMFRR